mmetsp:Transcript_7748/g.13493  ORF Transcript_7748/g.13493 Transcript_7748/m.13493 type:complete len:150 (-) Transcript_7748:77-526(-)
MALCAQTGYYCHQYNSLPKTADDDDRNRLESFDLWTCGGLFSFAWLLINLLTCCVFGLGGLRRDWSQVYQDNKEPYHPVIRCACRSRFQLQSNLKKSFCCEFCGQNVSETRFLTPLDGPAPVPSLEDRKGETGNKRPTEAYLERTRLQY